MMFSQGEYSEFFISQRLNLPQPLIDRLREAWNKKYIELYENPGIFHVEEEFKYILNVFGAPADTISHQRFVYMAMSIAVSAQPLLKHHFPNDYRPNLVLEKVNSWLEMNTKVSDNLADLLFPDINERGISQATDEAYNIFYGLLVILNKENAYETMIDILYDAITGDAISSFAAAKRDLFNWWLIDVTPSAYCLQLSAKIYPHARVFPPLTQ